MTTSSPLGAGASAQTPSGERGRLTQYVWYAIFLLALVNVFNYVDRMALAVLAPTIKADLKLSDAQLGSLIGFAFSVFYAICGIPIARWADRGIRRNIIALAVAIWSVMTALSGSAQNFWHMFVARIGVGIGEAGCLPPAQSIICDYVPLKQRSGVFAIHTFGLYAGMMLGMALAGWLSETIGWRLTFVVLGLPGIALAILVKLSLQEPSRGVLDNVKEDERELCLGDTLSALWSCRTYRLLLVFTVVNGFVQYGMSQWLPSFYSRVHGVSLSSVGIYLGLSIGAGSGMGLLVGGLLANKVAGRDVRLPLIVGTAATAAALPTALGSLFVSSAPASMVLVALTSVLWSISNGPVLAALYSVVTSRMRATAGSITIFFSSVLGFGLGPFCVGMLSDVLASTVGGEALRYALVLPACFLVVMAIVLFAATKTLLSDLSATGNAH